MNLNCFSFILAICLSSIYVQPALANWPVFSIKKGGTAVVPCVPKGDETAYFWSRGEDFSTSQSVASRVLGIPSSDSEKYSVNEECSLVIYNVTLLDVLGIPSSDSEKYLVNEEGSLVIYNVTLSDEGIYHCRIVSENTNCRGAVSINVKVNDFSFGIEQCKPNESCILQVEPSDETNLTCTAKGGPSSLSLKWLNGSKEITSVYSEHSMNEESITVSETITVPNEFGLILTCAAFACEDGPACTSARSVHVMLQKTYEDESLFEWIFILLVIILMIILASTLEISSFERISILLVIIFMIIMTSIYDISLNVRTSALFMIISMIVMINRYGISSFPWLYLLYMNTFITILTKRYDESSVDWITILLVIKLMIIMTILYAVRRERNIKIDQLEKLLHNQQTRIKDITAELEKVKNDLTEKETTLTESRRKPKRRSGETSSLKSGEISYQDIASSKKRSYEFVLRCISSVRRSGVPYATFRVYRQHDSTSISFRPKIWNDVSEDEEP